MYRGYNLRISKASFAKEHFAEWAMVGAAFHAEHKQTVKKVLSQFVASDGKVDASKMQENWFPQIHADVFISHSHADQEIAIAFGGWLKSEFGIESFIDSCAWGYSDDLIRMIDDKFCFNEDKGTYSYDRRNRSTSHVYMMLSTALAMMIDRAECTFFLNTPSSMTPNEIVGGVSGTTKSPWIYFEIAITRLIQKRSRDDHRGILKKSAIAAEKERMDFLYAVNLRHLTELSSTDLGAWLRNKEKHKNALDALYELK